MLILLLLPTFQEALGQEQGIDNSGLLTQQDSVRTYVIEYTYQDSNSCEGSDQINITIVDKPVVNIIETDFSLCIDARNTNVRIGQEQV